ncbi:hypothetical protein BDB00DRAFT_867621 [Zychaea mexicana]|uniref:uncharacterized protein n=1 Tax=Zychaea mexicana TaxID=64656 RepID=UPI0022FDE6FC|nr:uncharacterized protein BDB00DRAFT_867621 [Zychaea mexicana]KAI9498473.1 hypothetical protein BDB00DRAFT_867621 [Zychaea mexicana]
MATHTTTKLSVYLHPEFGWTAANTTAPVFGPGSVLRGSVRVHLPSNQQQQPDQLRIVFHASETLTGVPNADAYSVDGRYRHEQFFGSQRILWTSKDKPLENGTELSFTIQLPMVQFPPSIEIANFYACRFRLSTFLEGPTICSSNSDNYAADSSSRHRPLIAKAQCPVVYVPQIETRASKEASNQQQQTRRPFTLEAVDKQQRNFKLQLDALDYIAGDTIQPLIYQPPAYRISMKLLQVFTIHAGKQKTFTRPIAESTNTQLLEIPDESIPSFTYGRLVSVSYKLRVSFHSREIGLSSRLLLPLKSSSSSAVVSFPDIPIRIGTLGYGIRSSDELQIYTAFQTIFRHKQQNTNNNMPPLPIPRYVSSVGYKDTLPLYENYQLPSYQEQQQGQQAATI